MATIESDIKSQFETVFQMSDWNRFKKIAEFNLKEAATLTTSQMAVERSLRLLARNSRKRLLIGVGTELLIKAAFLKNGYAINKQKQRRGFALAKFVDIDPTELDATNTYKFDDLITHLSDVVTLTEPALVDRGLKIVKVFRNKEGHCVTSSHKFDPTNFEDIAHSIRCVYESVFSQRLDVVFAMAKNEKSVWRLKQVP